MLDELEQLVRDISSGLLDKSEAIRRFKDFIFEDLGEIKLDHSRILRTGQPEVIFAERKTPEQVVRSFVALKAKGNPVLATRASHSHFEAVASEVAEAVYEPVGRCIYANPRPVHEERRVVAVSAGTSDLPVLREASVAARVFGNDVVEIPDVGIAGLVRLLAQLETLRSAQVIIAVAGMDGALPAVLAGLVACPVIAVPTSIGYGAAFGGISALLTMLNTCAPNVMVVNIDNGFGAAYNASIITALCQPR